MSDSSKQRRQMKHTACPNRATLVALLNCELPVDVTNELAGHVESCAACERVLESIEDSPASLLPELRGVTPSDISRAQRELSLQQSFGATGMMELRGAGSGIQHRLILPCDFGQYRLEEHAGRGGMGDVYKGIQKSLNRPTAIKFLRPHRSTSEAAAARFLREMQIVARLDHPNLVKAYDGGKLEGRLYLAMELLDGETLADYVKRKGPFTSRRACRICIRAARGLQHAHDANLYHRDIKPGNIMLTRDGKVKVLDLGLALMPQDDNNGNRKDSVSFAGTPEFMPPEQARDAASADARSDIYALGCTLYFLLTGSSVYPRAKYPSVVDCISAHQNELIPDIRRINSEVPEELAAILKRMLCKNPNGRPQTAVDVCKLLEPFSQGDSSDFAERNDSTPRSVRAIPASFQWLLIFVFLVPLFAVPGYLWSQKYFADKSEIGKSESNIPQTDLTKANGSGIVESAESEIDRPTFPVIPDSLTPPVESLKPVASKTSDATKPAETENESEWSELFNGADLSGWTYITTDLSRNKSNQSWYLDKANRVLRSDGTDWNQIQTEKEFQDFNLSFEFRVDPGASDALGVQVRVRSPHELPVEGLNEWLTRLSAENQQVVRDRGNRIVLNRVGVLQKLSSGVVNAFGTPIKHAMPLDIKPFGRLIEAQAVQIPALKRPEEWNNCELRCRGEVLTTSINGALINEVTGLEAIKGAIAFNHEGEKAYLRNIRIRDLGPASINTVTQAQIPAQPETNPEPPATVEKEEPPSIDLLEAASLKKWKGVVATLPEQAKLTRRELDRAESLADRRMKQHWRVVDGVLQFDGNGDSIATESEYTDFELSLDWKISPGGDSGVYLRGCPQVQIWDPNSGKPNANLGSGGLYNNKTHQRHPLVMADRPVGEWNTMVISMMGDRVTVDLNGRRVVQDIVFENFYEPTKPVYPRGRIELQSFGGYLWFRNIHIRDLSTKK